MAGPPTVFLSHSHADKGIARCLLRRLSAHGVKVWIDERDLRLGAILTESIRAHIKKADVLLVVASRKSTVSKWVGLELEFAQQHSKTIIPFFVESVANHERFESHLGIDAISPQTFSDGVYSVVRGLYQSNDLKIPPVSRRVLEDGLRELAREEPNLAPMILGCLDSEGLHIESEDTVFNAPFHQLDYALNALFDLIPNNSTTYCAAHGFFWAGAGTRVLSSWIAATGDGGLQLVSAIGHARFAPALIPTALKLLGGCNPPNNQALYGFIEHNAATFDPEQRRAVLRLITWPVRTDASRLADVLGWVASKHFPDAIEIPEMWSRWIRDGAFDGEPNTPKDLGWYLVEADRGGLSGWKRVNEALRSHVRHFLRSGDKDKVMVATDHICAAADLEAPILVSLLREAEGVSATAEWDDWMRRDPDTAKWMRWYVSNIVEEAKGGRDWLKALQEADELVKGEDQRRSIVAATKSPPKANS